MSSMTTPAARIVVGVDDSRSGLAALRWAVNEARSAGVELLAVRCWELGLPRHGGRRRHRASRPHPHIVLDIDGFEQCRVCAELVRRSLRLAGGGEPSDIHVTIATPEGEPGQVLTTLAGPGDLLVVGREPELNLNRMVYGSVSGYRREHARCPVFVVDPGDIGLAGSSAESDTTEVTR